MNAFSPAKFEMLTANRTTWMGGMDILPFPLTPALSPGERENRLRVSAPAQLLAPARTPRERANHFQPVGEAQIQLQPWESTERGDRFQPAGEANALTMVANRPLLLPLPWGKGWGEGELGAQVCLPADVSDDSSNLHFS
jgi:hypothetical protein